MPPKPAPHCKQPGCTAPRHVYPSGALGPYCTAHLHLRKKKSRDEFPPMTGEQTRLLTHLRNADAYIPRPDGFDPRTFNVCFRNDWIFISGHLMKITTRGLEALEVYQSARGGRRDGICPDCNLHPRGVRPNGKIMAYCPECERKHYRIKQARLRRQPEYTERLCCRCHLRPRFRHAGGLGSSYCVECERERSRNRQARKTRLELAQAQAGDVKPCAICGERPRMVFENSISHYCQPCARIANRRWKLKRLLRARGMR